MVRLRFACAIAVVCLTRSAIAQTQDSDARRELEQGYALRNEGKFVDALPHLLESYRLDPQLKTLINLADCEEHVGKLVDAQTHWQTARNSAAREGSPEIQAEAERRVASLQARTPRLRIVTRPGAPPSLHIDEDGVPMPQAGLGTFSGVDPGHHTFVVRADGFEPRSYEVIVQAQESRDLAVEPGAKARDLAAPPPERAASTPTRPLRVAGAVTVGIGLASVGVGAFFGLDAISEQSSAHCPNNVCGTTGSRSTLEAAVRAGNISTALFFAGGILIVGGSTMWLLAPSTKRAPARVGLAAGVGTFNLVGVW